MTRSFLAILLLASGLSTAQDEAPPAVGAEEPVAEEAPNAMPPVEEKVGLLQGRLEALEEQFRENKAVLSALSKLKLSGYVQARWSLADNSLSGVDSAAAPLVKDGFSVRRGRLKAAYQGTVAQLVLQIDATPTGVTLKDAEASVIEWFSGRQLITVTLGQTKLPFGYEAVQSSSEREFPERTRVVRAFLNGERDRGLKVSFKHKFLRANLGAFDGNGTSNRGYVGVDNDTEKDYYGRFAVDFKWLAAGISGAVGRTYRPTDATTPGRFYARNKLGLDAQVYLHLLPIGDTALKAEFIAGTTYQASNVERFGQPALGWYLLIVQNVGHHEQVAVRYDFFDGATDLPNGVDPSNPTKPAGTNQVHTFGVLVSHHFDEVLKASAVYEIPIVATGGSTDVAPKQNVFTLQLQAKF